MKTYSIVSEKSLQKLTQKVNQMIISGHKCLGGPFEDSKQNFNQAILVDDQKIETNSEKIAISANEYVSYEYFVHIKFRLQEGNLEQIYAWFEEYLTKYPYEGLKTCGIYDMENEAGEYAIMEYFDTAENYLKAIDRPDNPILEPIRKLVVPYEDGDHFIGSHGRLVKSFDHLMLK